MDIETRIDALNLQGQIIEVTENDYDFVDQPLKPFKFELTVENAQFNKYLSSGRFVAKQVIIALNGHPSAYLQAKINKSNAFAQVGHLNFTRTKQLNLANLYISEQQSDILFIIFNYEIDSLQYDYDFGQFFLSSLVDPNHLNNVLVLDTLAREYLDSYKKNIESTFFTKALTSTATSLFPNVPLLLQGNSIDKIAGSLLLALELNGINGEAVFIVPNENEIIYSNVIGFDFIQSAFPLLSTPITLQDAKQLIKKLNAVLYASGMFL